MSSLAHLLSSLVVFALCFLIWPICLALFPVLVLIAFGLCFSLPSTSSSSSRPSVFSYFLLYMLWLGRLLHLLSRFCLCPTRDLPIKAVCSNCCSSIQSTIGPLPQTRAAEKKSKRVGQKLCITWFPLAKTRPRPQDCFKGPLYLLRHMKANPWWCTEGLRWLLHAAKARAAASGKGDQVVCIPAPFASNTTTVWARQCWYIYCQSHTTIITTTTTIIISSSSNSTSMSAAWEIGFVLGAGVCGCLPDHSPQPKFKPNATVPCCPILRPGPKDGSSSKGWSPVITGARSPLQQYSKVWASAEFENCANFG